VEEGGRGVGEARASLRVRERGSGNRNMRGKSKRRGLSNYHEELVSFSAKGLHTGREKKRIGKEGGGAIVKKKPLLVKQHLSIFFRGDESEGRKGSIKGSFRVNGGGVN